MLSKQNMITYQYNNQNKKIIKRLIPKQIFLKKNICYYMLLYYILKICVHCNEPKTYNNTNNQILFTNDLPKYQTKQNSKMIYNKNGKLICKLTTPNIQLLHYMKIAHLTQPIAILYDQNIQPTWEITANQATITHNKIMSLHGNVQIKNLIQSAYVQYMTTNTAIIDLTTQDISSEKISISGICFHSIAEKMQSNLKKQTTTLSNKVYTSYIINKNNNVLPN